MADPASWADEAGPEGLAAAVRTKAARYVAASRELTADNAALLSDCSSGLVVRPVAGTALLFYSLLPAEGTISSTSPAGPPQVDNMSYHLSCDVRGSWTKLAANNWFRIRSPAGHE
eukprot:SAG22_NODE_2877_length_2133_cov_1.094887_2_plen_116_part_00